MNDSLHNDITDMLCYSASIKLLTLLTVVIMCVIQQYHRTHIHQHQVEIKATLWNYFKSS